MNSDAVKYLLWIVAVAALIWAFYGEQGDNARVPVSIPYSEFKRLLADGEVAKVDLRGHRADIVLNRAIVAGPKKRSTERVTTILPPMDDPDLLPRRRRAPMSSFKTCQARRAGAPSCSIRCFPGWSSSASTGSYGNAYRATCRAARDRGARAMVGRWGMSKEIGPMDVRESEAHPFLGREIAQPRLFSEATANQLDKAVRSFLLEAEQRAEAIVVAHRSKIERLIAELEAQETLDRAQIEGCLTVQEHLGREAEQKVS